MKRLFLLFIFVTGFSAYASLGRKVIPETLPQGICRVTLINDKTMDQFHCTGSHVGSHFIKTAAHCLQNSKIMAVQCLGSKSKIEVEKVEVYPHYNHRELVMDEYNRWQDHAVITTKSKLTTKPFTIVTNESLRQEVKQNSDECLIAGFGLQEQTSFGTGYLSGTLYSPKKLKKDGRILFSKGRYQYELLPGDSGGPLLCYNNGHWFDLGTASAHDWDHQSIYAPNSEVSHWLDTFALNKKELNDDPLPTSPKDSKLQVLIGETYYLKAYSTFFESSRGLHNGDNLHTTIEVTKIEGNRIFGSIKASGASKFFLCEPHYLCFDDSVTGYVLIDDIAGPSRATFPVPYDPFP